MMRYWLAILVTFSICTVMAQETVVYRWVDENNVVHFSHKYPTDKEYAEIKVQTSYAPSQEQVVKQVTAENEATEDLDKSSDLSQYSQEEIDNRCNSAKTNLKVLNSFDRVLVKNDQGEEQALSEEEKAKQVELSKKYIDIYCNTADTNTAKK